MAMRTIYTDLLYGIFIGAKNKRIKTSTADFFTSNGESPAYEQINTNSVIQI